MSSGPWCIIASMNMEPMSFWQLVLNNPEWAGLIANAIFAITTIGVIIWQVLVMKWQGHNSERHERIQNRLIRLQHEHEWALRKNQEREQLLKLGRKLHLDAGCLQRPSDSDSLIWEEMRDTLYELDSRLRVLDVATFTGEYDYWFVGLKEYVDAVLKAVLEEPSQSPGPLTRKALHDAEQQYKPINIFLDLEGSIRMELFDFKSKWDAALSPEKSVTTP